VRDLRECVAADQMSVITFQSDDACSKLDKDYDKFEVVDMDKTGAGGR
jgi:hypothetical protein